MRWLGRLPLSFVLLACTSTGGGADSEGGTGSAVDSTGACVTAPCDGTDGVDTGTPGGSLPCDVEAILAAHCQSCHAATPKFGAPMSLVDYADLMVPAVTDPTRSVGALVAERMVAEQLPMPPTDDVADADVAIVTEWIAAGMPAAADTCDPPDTTDTSDETGEPPPELPCDDPVLITANGGDGAKFEVPDVDDLYQCFTFASPFSGDEHGIAWAPIIDDERVIHHWLLLRAPDGTEPGQSVPCGDPFAGNGALLMGWAPGAPSFTLPDDVGLELPGPGEVLTLQIHYNNIAGYTDASDASGVALCAGPARANTAATVWLGTLNIDIPAGAEGYSTSGSCDTALLQQPINILSSWPHMHQFGASLKTEVLRGGDPANSEMLVEVADWNFNNQIYYPHEPAVVIDPGDVLRTTCTYDNPTDHGVGVGEGTGDEMCFNFALVYPIEAVGPFRQCGLL
jgi:Copper type II ascorbate-dependent monooxygenase, C-terminal domain/Copper type II ascorbate-dependent monooxygenase, N-terminal domain